MAGLEGRPFKPTAEIPSCSGWGILWTLWQNWIRWVKVADRNICDHWLSHICTFCARDDRVPGQASHRMHLRSHCPIPPTGNYTPDPLPTHHILGNHWHTPQVDVCIARQHGQKTQSRSRTRTCSRAGLGWLITKGGHTPASAWQIQGNSCGKVAPASFLHLPHALQAPFCWEEHKTSHVCLSRTSHVPNVIFSQRNFHSSRFLRLNVDCFYILNSMWPTAVTFIHRDKLRTPPRPPAPNSPD